jgi:large subunit ribosomal protein L24e
MSKCEFCKQELKLGTGKMLVKNDGKIFYFCSNKCQKNLIKLRRTPHSVKWVTKKVK